MKTILNGIFILFCLFLLENGYGQENRIDGLKFSKAFFISMSSGKLSDFIAIDTTIIIEKGKVWKITSSKSFMINDDFNPYENEVSFWINNQIINYYKSPFESSIWLPEGTYHLKLKSALKNKTFLFTSYISGIEYTIE